MDDISCNFNANLLLFYISGETISFPDLFGSNAMPSNGNNAAANSNGSTTSNSAAAAHMRSHQFLNVHQNMLAGSGLFAKSNIQQPCNVSSSIGSNAQQQQQFSNGGTNGTRDNFHNQASSMILSPNSGSSCGSGSSFMQSSKSYDNNSSFQVKRFVFIRA